MSSGERDLGCASAPYALLASLAASFDFALLAGDVFIDQLRSLVERSLILSRYPVLLPLPHFQAPLGSLARQSGQAKLASVVRFANEGRVLGSFGLGRLHCSTARKRERPGLRHGPALGFRGG